MLADERVALIFEIKKKKEETEEVSGSYNAG